jgi:hypothetical protein
MIVNTFTNVNKDKVRKSVVTMVAKGFSVSCHCGGIGVDWQFTEFAQLHDAQTFALQWIAPADILVKTYKG